jgi:UDP-glucose 4-epimerase
MGMRWLITGGCGFIGCALTKRLLSDEGNSIRVLDNLSVGSTSDLGRVCNYAEVNPGQMAFGELSGGAVQLCVGDILDEKITMAAAQGVDVIVHFAGNTGVAPSVIDPRADCMANVLGTLNMLEAARARKIPRFVFASSGAPVGEVDPPIHEELAPHPVSPYGASKLAAEGYCSAYYRSYGIATVALRFSNVYGPGSDRKDSVVAKFIKRALAGKPLAIYGDGSQTRDFIYIDDLVDAVFRSARSEAAGGEVFQIATNHETTLVELAGLLRGRLAACGLTVPDPRFEAPRVGDVKRNFSDISKARNMLDWVPATSLEDGLSSTIDYFMNR